MWTRWINTINVSYVFKIACNTMWILTHAFFEEALKPMSAALTFQICLNDSREIYVCS